MTDCLKIEVDLQIGHRQSNGERIPPSDSNCTDWEHQRWFLHESFDWHPLQNRDGEKRWTRSFSLNGLTQETCVREIGHARWIFRLVETTRVYWMTCRERRRQQFTRCVSEKTKSDEWSRTSEQEMKFLSSDELLTSPRHWYRDVDSGVSDGLVSWLKMSQDLVSSTRCFHQDMRDKMHQWWSIDVCVSLRCAERHQSCPDGHQQTGKWASEDILLLCSVQTICWLISKFDWYLNDKNEQCTKERADYSLDEKRM